ncbi:MAG: trypsin-like peptidase domain-containing protein [Patescibacteria group bacterium]
MFFNFAKKSPIIKIAKDIMPAMVSILISEKNKKTLKKSGNFDEVEISNGSGFIVDKSGVVLTNRHILSDQTADYSVIANDGEKFKAEIIARDPINDIAILKIANSHEKESRFPIVKLGDSNKIELGENVIAFGNALGIFKNTVSAGIVSGLDRHISAKINLRAEAQKMRGLIQTDAAINPGNSGGPLVNIKGEVIGINSVMLYGAENIGLAIPINIVKKDLEDLKKHGHIRRPLLGVRYLILNEDLKENFNLSSNHGALIINENGNRPGIVPKSPAESAGLKEKDIILEINNEKITSEKTIEDFLEDFSAGDILRLKILRAKKEFEINVALAERK